MQASGPTSRRRLPDGTSTAGEATSDNEPIDCDHADRRVVAHGNRPALRHRLGHVQPCWQAALRAPYGPQVQAAIFTPANPATSARAASSSGPVTTSLAQPNASHTRAE